MEQLGERLAVVESQITEVVKVNDKQNDYLVSIGGMLRDINTKLDKQKGFLAGIVFVVSTMATIAGLLIEWVSRVGHGV